ncbi:MAG: hypothetical protein H6Q60_431 [Oscillospiraceae bacterium]|nr:hypothetical protein [Oscillospiraceae bacterium]
MGTTIIIAGVCAVTVPYLFLLFRFVPQISFADDSIMNTWNLWQQVLYLFGFVGVYSLALGLCTQMTDNKIFHGCIHFLQFAIAAVIVQMLHMASFFDGSTTSEVVIVVLLMVACCAVLSIPGWLLYRYRPRTAPDPVRKYCALITSVALMLGSLYFWVLVNPGQISFSY